MSNDGATSESISKECTGKLEQAVALLNNHLPAVGVRPLMETDGENWREKYPTYWSELPGPIQEALGLALIAAARYAAKRFNEE